MNTYIQHNLGERAEFKTQIVRISHVIGSSRVCMYDFGRYLIIQLAAVPHTSVVAIRCLRFPLGVLGVLPSLHSSTLTQINPIAVDISSSSTHPTTTLPPLPSPSPPWFAANHIQLPQNEPLPSLEGCGLKSKHLSSLGNSDTLHLPLPFP